LVIGYERLLAYRELALSKYAPLDALIDERQICYVVEDVLQMSAQVGDTHAYMPADLRLLLWEAKQHNLGATVEEPIPPYC
jgi:hypothetical protein